MLTLVCAALALVSLTDRSLWIDETFTKAVAVAPSDRFFDDLAFNGGNMSLYLVFMRVWLVGAESDWWLRLPSVVFAAACVPALYLVATRFLSFRASLASIGLLAISASLLRYAQEARSYSLTTLLVILSWLACIRLAEEATRSSRRWFVAGAVAIVYAHLIGVLFVLAQLLWLLSSGRRREAVSTTKWIVPLTIPQLALAVGPEATEPDWIPPTSLDGASRALRFVTGSGMGTAATAMALTVIAAWSVGVYAAWRSSDPRWLVPLAWVVLPIAGILSLSVVSPMLVPRYLVMAVPGACLLVGMAWDAFPRLGAGLLAATVATSLVGLQSTATRTEPDWRTATQIVIENATPDEGVLFLNGSRYLVEHYWNEAGRPLPMPTPLTLPDQWGQLRRKYGIDVPLAMAEMAEADGVWIVDKRYTLDPVKAGVAGDPGLERIAEAIDRRWPLTDRWSIADGSIVVARYGGR